MTFRRVAAAVTVAVALVVGIAVGGAWAANPFVDIAGNTHSADIDAIYNAGITLGCTDATHYCPSLPVTRDQMASFLARTAALGKGHLPVANGRGPQQSYCAIAKANPPAFDQGPCGPFTRTIDSTGDVGQYSAIAVGTDGFPIISYYDNTNGYLRVAHCDDATCSTSTKTSIDTVNHTTGQHTSIAIGSDGLAVIAYYRPRGSDLVIVHCENVECTNWIQGFDDHSDNEGEYTSIAIGTDGFPIVSYYGVFTTSLKVVHCGDLRCTPANATATFVDVGPDRGRFSSIAIGSDGLPVISYQDVTAHTLKVAHCNNVACSTSTNTTIPTDTPSPAQGYYTSIAIGTDGLPIISELDEVQLTLTIVHCGNVACTASTHNVIDATFNVGYYTSIAIGTDGLALVSYYDNGNGQLRLAHCSNVACTSATTSVLDTGSQASTDPDLVGQYTSIAIGTDGQPIISYYDATAHDLKVARPPA